MIAIMHKPLFAEFVNLARRTLNIEAGQTLFKQGDPVRHVFCVVVGAIALVRHGPSGEAITLQKAHAGNVLAEASVYAATYHCDAVARVPSRVAEISRRDFQDRCVADPTFAATWSALLAREVQTARRRAEILALKRLDDRLNAWLAWHGGLPPKGAWRELADEIGVTPEALYRALAKRRRTASTGMDSRLAIAAGKGLA
jgi:CRP-like cAMP-binding protein